MNYSGVICPTQKEPELTYRSHRHSGCAGLADCLAVGLPGRHHTQVNSRVGER